ncbi:MAG: TetR family transcriptional regulator C-terminal domain-containing protein [Sandaracinaceae bacterium]|nr:TetR family transcriptional regulator C-terminal domain-containing protein [Sandaracinaceae bacterium]
MPSRPCAPRSASCGGRAPRAPTRCRWWPICWRQALHDESLRPQLAGYYRFASSQTTQHLVTVLASFGLRPRVSPELIPRLLLGLLDGLVMQVFVEPEVIDEDELVRSVELIAGALFEMVPPEADEPVLGHRGAGHRHRHPRARRGQRSRGLLLPLRGTERRRQAASGDRPRAGRARRRRDRPAPHRRRQPPRRARLPPARGGQAQHPRRAAPRERSSRSRSSRPSRRAPRS